MDALKKADIELEKELHTQIGRVYSSIAIALNNDGWGSDKLKTLMDRTSAYWDECAKTNEKSMIEMLYDETGIELKPDPNGKSWYEVPYLNAKLRTTRMNKAQWIYMRQQQKKWVGAQVTACILYTLHRRWGYGFQRITKLLNDADAIRSDYNDNPKALREACRTITSVSLIDEGGNNDR